MIRIHTISAMSEGSSSEPAAVHGWHNFRDLGGIATADGARIRPGVLFRAGGVIAPGGLEPFTPFAIDSICDLRNDGERQRQPTPWRSLGAADYWCRAHAEQTGDLRRVLDDTEGDPEHAGRLMLRLYAGMPFAMAASYREIFARLAAGRVPLVFHCTAGKDRTGVLAALILAALGVDRATIMADYLSANAQAPDRLAQILGIVGDAARTRWRSVLVADPAYLDAMFAAIDAGKGGLDGYLAETIGLSPKDRTDLAAHLTERACL